jgi:predicted nucleic acid-binding protein
METTASVGTDRHRRLRPLRPGQVLQEFYVTVTRKISTPLSAAEAVDWIEQFEAFPCAAIESSHVKLAALLSERYQISYRGGAIVAADESLGASTLFTEDLNHGQRYASVTAINLFLSN